MQMILNKNAVRPTVMLCKLNRSVFFRNQAMIACSLMLRIVHLSCSYSMNAISDQALA